MTTETSVDLRHEPPDTLLELPPKYTSARYQLLKLNGEMQLYRKSTGLYWAMWVPNKQRSNEGFAEIKTRHYVSWVDAIESMCPAYLKMHKKRQIGIRAKAGIRHSKHIIKVMERDIPLHECAQIIGVSLDHAYHMHKRNSLVDRVRYILEGGEPFKSFNRTIFYEFRDKLYTKEDISKILNRSPKYVTILAFKGELMGRLTAHYKQNLNQ